MAKQKIQQINWTTITIVAVLIVGFLLAIYWLYPRESQERTISVTGNSEMNVQPDRVVVYAQILTRSKDSAEEAKNLNSQITDAVLGALANAGVSKNEIETYGFSLYPEYDWIQDQGQVLKGYVATTTLKVTSADFSNAGKIVDAVGDNGGLINSINYELSNEKMNEYKASALAEASKDAKNKAESIATGLGKSLGDIVSVSASEYNYIPYPLYRVEAGTDAKQIATNLPSAKVQVTATVSVVYKVA